MNDELREFMRAVGQTEIVGPVSEIQHETLPARNVTRSPILWPGGKGRNSSWIVDNFIPQTHIYLEPFAGGASIFFRLHPRPVEAINDLDQRIVSLYRVLQGPDFGRLAHRIRFTLYSRKEFQLALKIFEDPNASEYDLAWATFVGCNQGFSGVCSHPGHWGKAVGLSTHGRAHTVSGWQCRQSLLERFNDRLSRAQIECLPALKFIKRWDDPEALIYCDPPYMQETRVNEEIYTHEMNDADHVELLETLKECKAAVVISGYHTDVYNRRLESWKLFEKQTTAGRAARRRNSTAEYRLESQVEKVPRTECVWVNPKCEKMLASKETEQGELF